MFYTYVPNTIKTRKRTTPSQLEILEGVFVTDKKPNAPRRKDLAKKLKMSPREVQVMLPSCPKKKI
jgi:Mn-dependent DtxR family transcriptional regulator